MNTFEEVDNFIRKKYFVYRFDTQSPAGAEKDLLKDIHDIILKDREERNKKLRENIEELNNSLPNDFWNECEQGRNQAYKEMLNLLLNNNK